MADILLQKPQAGQVTVITPQPEDRLVFEFAPGDAVLERQEDNLVLSFDDGSRVELADFYVAYTSENMPEFLVDGGIISGQDFFAALNNDDLMPALGPAAGTPTGSGTVVGFGAGSLLGGIDRLERIDQEYPEPAEEIGFEPGVAGVDDDGGAPQAIAATTPVAAAVNNPPTLSIEFDQDPSFDPNLIPNFDASTAYLKEAGVGDTGFEVNEANQGYNVSGRINISDADPGDTLTLTVGGVTNPSGTYYIVSDGAGGYELTATDPGNNSHLGTFDINANNEFTITLNNNNPLVNELAENENLSFNLEVSVSDGITTIPGTLSGNIEGTNEQPTFSLSTDTLGVTEDAASSSSSGNIIDIIDADSGASHTFFVANGAGGLNDDETGPALTVNDTTLTDTWGTFDVDASGEFTFTIDNNSADVQALAKGQTKDLEYTIYVQDDKGAWTSQVVTVTITGENDKPSVEIIPNKEHKEKFDGIVTESGVRDNPADATDGPNTAYDGSRVDKGTIKISDVDTIDTHTLTVGGEEITAGTKYYVVSDGNGGYELDTNKPANDDHFGVMTFTKNSNNEYDFKFKLNNDNDTVNALPKDGSLDLKLDISAYDGTENSDFGSLGIEIQGTNDQPVITTYTKQLNATEDGAAVKGTAIFDDVDTGDTHEFFVKQGKDGKKDDETGPALTVTDKSATNKWGTFEINDKGEYIFTVDNTSSAVQALAAGETKNINYTIYVKDNNGAWTSQVVKVTITGANDTPSVSVDDSDNIVIESGVGEVDGPNDTDAGDSLAEGTISISDLDTINTHTLTVGGQDIVAGTKYYVVKNAAGTGYELTATQPAGDAEFAEVVFTKNSNNSYDYDITLNNDNLTVNQLPEGGSLDLSLSVTTTDSSHATSAADSLDITVKGTNDQPVITTYTTQLGATEDGAAVDGSASFDDVDTGDTHEFFVKQGDHGKSDDETGPALTVTDKSVTNEWGTFEINDKGEYIFTVDNTSADVQALAAGEPKEINYTIYVKDNNGAWTSQVVKVTITGANDVPQISSGPENLYTDDSYLTDGTKGTTEDINGESIRDYDSGVLVFTSAEDMNGGTIVFKHNDDDGNPTSTTLSITLNNGVWEVSPSTVDGQYGSITINGLTQAVDGTFTLVYTYKQDTAYEHNRDGNDFDALHTGAEKFDVTINDKHTDPTTDGTLIGNQTTITVNIEDDGPIITAASGYASVDHDNNAATPDATQAVVNNGQAEAKISIDFGADKDGAMILSPNTGTDIVGVKWENGTWVTMESANFPGVPVDYDFVGGVHTITLGDIVMTSTDNENWTVTFKSDATDKTLIFEDGDGDRVSHVILAPDTPPAPPVIDSVTHVEVSEAFISGGTKGAPSADDVTYDGIYTSNTATGKIEYSDVNGGELTFAWNLKNGVPTDKDGNAIDLKTSDDNEPLVWSYGETNGVEDRTILIGKSKNGGDEVIRLDMDTTTNEYTVVIKEGVEHNTPDGGDTKDYNTDLDGAKDVLGKDDKPTNLKFGFTVTDEQGQSTSSDVILNIEDDILEVGSATQKTTSNNSGYASDTLVFENHKSELEGKSEVTFKNAGGNEIFTATAVVFDHVKGEVVTENNNMKPSGSFDIGKSPDGTGLSINSSIDSTGTNPNTTDGRVNITLGADESEAIVLTLPVGEVAYSTQLDIGAFFSNEGGSGETMTVYFMRDGELVHKHDLIGTMSTGEHPTLDYAVAGGFDQIILVPTDNGASGNLNSDFFLSSVKFDSPNSNLSNITTGELVMNAADGIADVDVANITITDGNGNVYDLSDLEKVGNLIDGTHYKLEDKAGNIVFELQFNIDTEGNIQWTSWSDNEYSSNIGFTVTDNDGDNIIHQVEVAATPDPDINSIGEHVDSVKLTSSGASEVQWASSGYHDEDGKPVGGINEIVKYDGHGFTVDTGLANDHVELGKYNDTIYLGESSDSAYDAHPEKEVAAQKAMEEFMKGDDDSILINPSEGEDSALKADNSNAYLDLAHGGGGNDIIYGEEGIDAIFGGSGDDMLYGGLGNDGLRGGTGKDRLDGGEGKDYLKGGADDDLLILDLNDMLIDGGEGEMDILLGGSTSDRDDVLDAIAAGTITNIEMIVLGKDAESSTNIDQVLKDLGLNKNQLGTDLTKANGWNRVDTENGFVEFTTNRNGQDITILVEQAKVESGS